MMPSATKATVSCNAVIITVITADKAFAVEMSCIVLITIMVQRFSESLHQKKALSAERSLSLIQFAVQQVLRYGFIPVTRAWRASAVL